MVTEMEQYQQYRMPAQHRGMWFHVFVTNPENGKQGYLGPYNTEDDARNKAIEAVGIEGEFVVHRSMHRDSAVAKQEYRHKKFQESGKLWETLKPIRNVQKGNNVQDR